MTISVPLDKIPWGKALAAVFRIKKSIQIKLTEKQLMDAYREVETCMLIEDAISELCDDLDHEDFQNSYGFTIEEAIDPLSRFYMADKMVRYYNTHYEMGIPAQDQWYWAACRVAETIKV